MRSIESIFLAIEQRDSFTAYHQKKVAFLSLMKKHANKGYEIVEDLPSSDYTVDAFIKIIDNEFVFPRIDFSIKKLFNEIDNL